MNNKVSAPGLIINKGRNITADYNEINLLEMDNMKQAKLEMWIAKQIGDKVIQHYPNREWGVQVDISGAMVILTCTSVSTSKGYHMHMKGDNIHGLQERAIMACGQILERYSVSRNRIFNPDHVDSLERDIKDEVISTDAAPDPINVGS